MSPVFTMFESLVAFAIIAAILLAAADTPLYPLAFGAVLIMLLYNLLNHPTILPSLTQWAGAQLHGGQG